MIVLASWACSGAHTGSPFEGGSSPVRVTVDNDLSDRTDVLVRIVPGNGVPSTLGGVAAGQRGEFRLRDALVAGSYALTASTGDGRVLRSRAFTLFPEAVVVWRLQLNELRVLAGSGGPARLPDRVSPLLAVGSP